MAPTVVALLALLRADNTSNAVKSVETQVQSVETKVQGHLSGHDVITLASLSALAEHSADPVVKAKLLDFIAQLKGMNGYNGPK